MKINNRFVKSTKIFTRCKVVFYNPKSKKEEKQSFDLPGRWNKEDISEKRFKKFMDFCNVSFVKIESALIIKKTGILPEEDFFNNAEIIDTQFLEDYKNE